MTEGRTYIWCQKFKGPGFTAPYLDGLMPPQEEKQITSEDIVPPWNSLSLSLSLLLTQTYEVFVKILQLYHVEVVQWTTV